MDRLCVRPPVGRVLDVACGEGGTTRRLCRYTAPETIIGINISERQVARARQRAPGCAFEVMDATQLAFADESFDCVVCVEAAFHFATRDAFLKEAFRVLRPGGRLLMTDILFRVRPPRTVIPAENHVADLSTYTGRLEALGFREVCARDRTDKTWKRFRAHLLKRALRHPRALWTTLRRIALYDLAFKAYLLVMAEKPAARAGAGSIDR